MTMLMGINHNLSQVYLINGQNNCGSRVAETLEMTTHKP